MAFDLRGMWGRWVRKPVRREPVRKELSVLDRALLQISPQDSLTFGNAVEGMSTMGNPGSGKSTGTGANLLMALMAAGCGGLVCCVKLDERKAIEHYAALTGRSKSLVIVSPDERWRCNLLGYLLHRPGIKGSRTEPIVNLLMVIVEIAERGERNGGKNDRFWDRALRQVIRNAVEIFIAAGEPLSVAALHRFITSSPSSVAEAKDEGWRSESYCFQVIERAYERRDAMPPRQQQDMELAVVFWLKEFPQYPEETRGSILATWGTAAEPLMRGQLADLFGSDTNFVPEVSFSGAIIVLDLPTRIYGKAGLVLQGAFKYVWQLAAESRRIEPDSPVAFLFADEFHELFTEHDAAFFATARSSRIASIVISQNLANYYSALGGEQGRHQAEAMLGNLSTHIWHTNGHSQTNEWAAKTIADHRGVRANYQTGHDGRSTGGGSEDIAPKVLASTFTELSKGGPPDFVSEAIVFRAGARFLASGETYLRVGFPQILR